MTEILPVLSSIIGFKAARAVNRNRMAILLGGLVRSRSRLPAEVLPSYPAIMPVLLSQLQHAGPSRESGTTGRFHRIDVLVTQMVKVFGSSHRRWHVWAWAGVRKPPKHEPACDERGVMGI